MLSRLENHSSNRNITFKDIKTVTFQIQIQIQKWKSLYRQRYYLFFANFNKIVNNLEINYS